MKTLPTLLEEDLALAPLPDAGLGALRTEEGCLPLRSVDVRARVDGLLAQVELRQTFVNTFARPLEATYIFPLPDRAAVTNFRLEVAGRVVEGELKERGQARRDYDEAIKRGNRAALAEEERAGVFTVRVGNLPPGEATSVQLTLTGPLPYSDGEATFRFPLVVAPRYIPGNSLPGPDVGSGTSPDTDAVPDASRITPPVLLPGFPNPVQLSIYADFPPSALKPAAIRSSLHSVMHEVEEGTARVVLHPGERLDRDFVLRFRLAGDSVRTALTLQPDAQGDEGTFALTLVPPTTPAERQVPRDIVFVLDRSGSMGGWKMVAARRAMGRVVETLTDADRFTVLAFDDRIVRPPSFGEGRLLPATSENRFRASEFLAKIEAEGGTEMAQPLMEAVGLLAAEGNRQRTVVLVTDGQVGNEDQILRELGRKLKGIRVFTLGIDTAVNAAFLKRLADAGGGGCELVESEERLEEVMGRVHRHVGTPVLTGLRLEADGLGVVPDSVVPARLPDLFAGAPVVVLGRYQGRAEGGLRLAAQGGDGRPWSLPVRAEGGCPASTTVWARGRVRDLEDRYAVQPSEPLSREITVTSLRFGVLCRFTAFVAVDRVEVVNEGGRQQRMTQPVEMPAGWAEEEEMVEVVKGSFTGVTQRMRVPARLLSPPSAPAAPPPSPTDPAHLAIPEADLSDRAYGLPLGETPAKDGAEDADIFSETDFEVPAVEEESGSEALALDDVDFDDADFDESDSGVSLLEDSSAALSDDAPGEKKREATASDRTADHTRALGLQKRIAQAGSDPQTKLAALKTHLADLRQFADDLLRASAADREVQQFVAAVRDLEALLQEVQPGEARILAVWGQVERALAALVTAFGGQPTPGRAEFWK